MSREPEKMTGEKDVAPRSPFSVTWMVGSVVAGFVLLGFSIFDSGILESEAAPAAAVAEPVEPATVVSHQSVSMQVGQKREVLLNSDSCSGNVWQLAEELPADSPVAVSLSGAEPDETNCCGFPVPVTLTISALKPGSAVLRLVYANPKEKAPARQEEFKVTVSAADAVE